MDNKEKIVEVLSLLKKKYPEPVTELNFENEMQLAVAVMLSAQTTDKKVNQVTPGLFKKYQTWQDFASAELPELIRDIHGVNFHIGKADRLIKAGKVVFQEFGGKLPNTIDKLIIIPGIARKSANVIMNELWNKAEGVVVDTHIARVSFRLGFTQNTDPVKIEKELMSLVPLDYWRFYSGAVVLHGRYVCTARRPKCSQCILNGVCPSAFNFEGTR